MNDYTWPSVYFAYLFFTISLGVGIFFFVRSWKDGYWNKSGEQIKYCVFEDETGATEPRQPQDGQELTHGNN